MAKRLLTVDEAARELGIKPSLLRQMKRDGAGPGCVQRAPWAPIRYRLRQLRDFAARRYYVQFNWIVAGGETSKEAAEGAASIDKTRGVVEVDLATWRIEFRDWCNRHNTGRDWRMADEKDPECKLKEWRTVRDDFLTLYGRQKWCRRKGPVMALPGIEFFAKGDEDCRAGVWVLFGYFTS